MTDRDPSAPKPTALRKPMPNAMIPEAVECPFCSGTDTEQFAAFGSALSVSQYWCRKCRTVFEWMKWREAET